ncbi:MAG TPA: hypothetical protein VGZ22_30995 [Isosphaeraceae bacterium]|jgi:outer membrane lipoprotein-sorting protein|nr:hypothetical protein [Isosphaeraceae bacterium]
MVARRAWLAVLALLASAGCRAAGVGSLAPRQDPIAAQAPLAADRVIAQINSNARKVESLKANPSITVYYDRHRYAVDGKLALERPRNFKLDIRSTVHGKEADIGSNDRQFWFWTRQNSPKARKEYYVGRYEDAHSVQLAAFQPDWIIESFGLREIPADEATSMKVERKRVPNSTRDIYLLTNHQRTREAQSITKVTTVDASSGLILKQELYEGDRTSDPRALLARAEVVGGKFHPYKVEPDADGQAGAQVVLPALVRLDWPREGMRLDVELREPELNPTLRAELFDEPTDLQKMGYQRVDLGTDPGLAGPATIRESRPAPPSGVRLDEPEPIGRNDRSLGLGYDIPGLASGSTTRLSERVVGPRLPSPPESNSAWLAAQGDGYGR